MLNKKRKRKKTRTRSSLSGKHPRLLVYKSNKYIYAQIVDKEGNVLVSANQKELKAKKGSKSQLAQKVGEKVAKKAKAKKIKRVDFDRSGYRYHGRVKELAEGARKGGLEF